MCERGQIGETPEDYLGAHGAVQAANTSSLRPSGSHPPGTVLVHRADLVAAHSMLSWLRHRNWRVVSDDDKELIRLLDRQWGKLLYG